MKWTKHIGVVAVIALILVYGLLNPDQFPFPRCPFLTITGWKCPGCGSQRALHQFLHGNFFAAFRFNPLFIPALVYSGYGYFSMAVFPKHWVTIKEKWYSRRAAVFILGIIIMFWIGRNMHY